ncbi:WhiB family transcriptional regulator, partial [Micromonospora sp. 15K316]|uniref:WhiB family transcriptional regulator n=1 Tax=Micromonospora sp. 15K316 TaxID=2530376 RepID=UPI00104BB0B3
PDIMFPAPRDRTGTAIAKAICRDCPVKRRCQDWADDADERHGIWGGLTPTERGRPTNRPRVVLPARTCARCGDQFRSGRSNQSRCYACLGKYPTLPPRDILQNADKIADLKRRKIADETIAIMNGWKAEQVTAARRLLGIDSRGNTRPTDGGVVNVRYRRRSKSTEV